MGEPAADGPSHHAASGGGPPGDYYVPQQQRRREMQARVVRIISGKEYGADDVLAVVADPEVCFVVLCCSVVDRGGCRALDVSSSQGVLPRLFHTHAIVRFRWAISCGCSGARAM